MTAATRWRPFGEPRPFKIDKMPLAQSEADEALTSGPIFNTKILVPRLWTNSLRRSRLINLFQRESQGRIAIVRAPAGYGKTTLLVNVAHEAAGSVHWLSLDAWDRDYATFAQYLWLAVRGEVERPLGAEVPAGYHRSLLADVVSALGERPDESWLFLDDFHEVDGCDDIAEFVDYLAQRLPFNCRLIIASRTRPQLASLPRLRVTGRVLELGPGDLCFSGDEIRDYYISSLGRSLDEDGVELILRDTQGWPAAVALLQALDAPGDAARSRATLHEYMTHEIFERLSPVIQEFLLGTSVLDTLSPEICDGVLDRADSIVILNSLDGLNLPLMAIQAENAIEYRVHPLLRDYLRARLRSQSPELYHHYNQRAGTWRAGKGQVSEAVWHFGQAMDWEAVVDLVLKEAPTAYRAGRWHTITSWLSEIPRQHLQRRPELGLWEGRILARLGQADRALGAVTDIASRIDDSELVVRAQLETVRALALRLKGDMRWSLETATQAVDLAIRGNAPIYVVAEARRQLGHVLFALGSYQEAAEEFQAVLNIFEQRGEVEECAFVNGCLGSALGSLGRLAEASIHLERAKLQWENLDNKKELSWVQNNLGMVWSLLGDTKRARQAFNSSLISARASGHERAEAYALTSLAEIEREDGRVELALDYYQQALELAGSVGEMILHTYALTGMGDCYRRLARGREAETLIRQALASAEERASAYEQGIAYCALGRLRRQDGQIEEANSCFRSAVDSFGRVNADKDLAEALFFLADSLLHVRQDRSALRGCLERLATVVSAIGHSHFLVRLVSEAPAVVSYAASHRIGGDFYRNLLRVIEVTPSGARVHGEFPSRGGLPDVDVRALGGFDVFVNGRRVIDFEWESEKAKEMLLLLVVQQRPLRRDEITAFLWPDAEAKKAVRLFHSTIYRVRRAVYPECLVETDGAYTLNPLAVFSCDVHRFRALTSSGRRSEQELDSLDDLRSTLELYRGPFAPFVESEWAEGQRIELQSRFLRSAERLANMLFAQGDFQGTIAACERLLECDPYSETVWYTLMSAYAQAGDPESAMRAYRRFRELIRSDLGEDPGMAVTELYMDLKRRHGQDQVSKDRRDNSVRGAT